MTESIDEALSFEDRRRRRQYFESIFRRYDKDGSGYIDLKELRDMIKGDEEIPRRLIKKIFKQSDKNDDGKIDLDEFIDMLHDKNLRELFGDYVNSYVRFILPRQTYSQPDGAYEEQCSCCPPPIGMVIISILEICCFVIDEMNFKNSNKYGPGTTAKIFMYDPYKREEFWRYMTYMFVHIGHLHLVVNLAVQIMLGIPLEMVHGWWRVLTIYFAGVLMGSLLTSISDPTVYLAGASGGVYSLITAHIASIIMNWREMSFPGCQLFIFILVTGVDVGTSIYNRYFLDLNEQIGYVAHFGGAIAGLLVGIWILKNLEVTKKEKYIWWCALVLYILTTGVAIVLNLCWTSHFP